MKARGIPFVVIVSACLLLAGCVLRGTQAPPSTPLPETLAPNGFIQSQPYPVVTPLNTQSGMPYPFHEISPKNTKVIPTLLQSEIMTISPERMATLLQSYIDMADITLNSSIGQTYTYTLSSRFFVFLDDDKYPVRQLKCEPEWIMGYVSEGSFMGFDSYPIYYEATKIGKCTLRNGDFFVNIVVIQRTPRPTYAPSYP